MRAKMQQYLDLGMAKLNREPLRWYLPFPAAAVWAGWPVSADGEAIVSRLS
jgi:hypothetical protein